MNVPLQQIYNDGLHSAATLGGCPSAGAHASSWAAAAGAYAPVAAGGAYGPVPAFPPSVAQVFQLSDGAGYVPASDALDVTDRQTMQQLYSGYRIMGAPGALRLSQAQGDIPFARVLNPVYGAPGTVPVNPSALTAAVDGRFVRCAEHDDYRGDTVAAGFVPASTVGLSAVLPRQEQYLGTVSVGLADIRTSELLNPQQFAASYQQQTMNLTPVSEAAAQRESDVARINRMQRAYVARRIAAATGASAAAF